MTSSHSRKMLAIIGMLWIGAAIIVTAVQAKHGWPTLGAPIIHGSETVRGGVNRAAPECGISLPDFDHRLRLGQSFALPVVATKDDRDPYCRVAIRIDAPAFGDTQPLRTELSNPEGKYSFILLPKEPGKQLIKIVHGDGDDWIAQNVVVYKYPGIPPDISLWFPGANVILGGMLSIPWWLDRLGKKK